MHAPIPGRLLDVLTEGSILRHVEREPAPPGGLRGAIKAQIGRPPAPDRFETLIDTLVDADRIRAGQDPSEPPVYHLTQDGARLLHAYRHLSQPVTAAVVDLLGLEVDAARPAPPPEGATPPAPSTRTPTREPVQAASASEAPGWSTKALACLPTRPTIRARYAQISLERDAHRRAWTLHVENHDPRAEASREGPLTFLYAAATKLLKGSTFAHRSLNLEEPRVTIPEEP